MLDGSQNQHETKSLLFDIDLNFWLRLSCRTTIAICQTKQQEKELSAQKNKSLLILSETLSNSVVGLCSKKRLFCLCFSQMCFHFMSSIVCFKFFCLLKNALFAIL